MRSTGLLVLVFTVSVCSAATVTSDPPGAVVWTSAWHDPALVHHGTTPTDVPSPDEAVQLILRLEGHHPVFTELTPGQERVEIALEPITEDPGERLAIGFRDREPGLWLGPHGHAEEARLVLHDPRSKPWRNIFWWSPDGRFIAWQRATVTGEGDEPAPRLYFFDRLYVIDVATCEAREIAWANYGGDGWLFNPSWSHDGEFLLYEVPWSREVSRSQLLAYRPADRSTRTIAYDRDANLWFSAYGLDGAVYYTKHFDDGRTELCVRDAAGERVLFGGHEYNGLCVTPEGTLHWLDERGLMALVDGEEHLVTAWEDAPTDMDFGPRLSLPCGGEEVGGASSRNHNLWLQGWSRDGQWLSVLDGAVEPTAWVVRADGSETVRIGEGLCSEAPLIRWGPGESLALLGHDRWDEPSRLWLMDSPQAELRLLFDGASHAGFGVSPDGSTAALVVGDAPAARICLLDVASGALTPITDEGLWSSVDWHPRDPNLLGFSREHFYRGEGCGAASFGMMDTSGRVLVETQERYSHCGYARWSSDGALHIAEDGCMVLARDGTTRSALTNDWQLSPDGAVIAHAHRDHIESWRAEDLIRLENRFRPETREGADEPLRTIYPFGEWITGPLCPTAPLAP